MGDLANRLKKAGSIKTSDVLSKSKFFGSSEKITTDVPALNIALSGEIDGGLTPGLTVVAGPSKHFKTNMSLVMVKAFLNKYPEGVCLFYDSEFGATPEYFESAGVDTSRVIHIPVEHVEQLKFDCSKRLEEIQKGDDVIILIDSIGTLASKKEIDDALDEKSVADMTRAKAIRSFFRILTPHLTLKDIPCIAVNHVYKTMEMYSKNVVSGGTSIMYSANTVFIIGRQQEKEGKEITGYNFIINIEKSRYVREGSKIPISVRFDGGIIQYSGLLDIALAGGYVVKPSNGWYQRANPTTGEVLEEGKHRASQTNTKDFWSMVFDKTNFTDYIEESFKVAVGDLIQKEGEDEESQQAFTLGEEDETT